MKNFWPEKFDASSVRVPKKVLGEQAAFIAKTTGGVVIAEVVTIPEQRVRFYGKELGFRFELVGPYLDSYRFSILSVYHDIIIYPALSILEEKIAAELELNPKGEVQITDSTEFEGLLERALCSNRIRSVVESIMALSV